MESEENTVKQRLLVENLQPPDKITSLPVAACVTPNSAVSVDITTRQALDACGGLPSASALFVVIEE